MRTQDILNSINRLLVELKPDFKVYVRFQAQELLRPAFFCEHIRNMSPQRLNRTVYRRRSVFQIIYFAPTDEYYRPDQLGLYDVADDILTALSDGYLTVGDRAPSVTADLSEITGREAFITVSVEYTERTAGAERKRTEEATMDKIQNISIKDERGTDYGNTTDQH